MNADLIRNWLGLADATWPPDDHLLLGVSRGERDLARIEHQVHERLATLRCHQIAHPEEATEGMNRLAQAFVHLLDGCKSTNCTPPPPTDVSAATVDTEVERKTKLDWQDAPPPVRRSGSTPVLGKKAAPKAEPAPNAAANTQMILSLAQDSPEARAGLGTLEAVVRRTKDTRAALVAWTDAGRWLNKPKRPVVSVADDQDLTRRLNAISRSLKSFPPIVGQPGIPGYRVAATARMQLNSLLVRGMDKDHRDLLALDWDHGRRVLLAHRKFLRKQFKALRNRGAVSRGVHAARAFVNDYPLVSLVCFFGLFGLALWFSLRR